MLTLIFLLPNPKTSVRIAKSEGQFILSNSTHRIPFLSHAWWSAGADAALTPEAQLRLDGLQDKLHDLQQQDAAEAAAAESGQASGVASPGGDGLATEEPLAAVPSFGEPREGSGGEDAVEGDGEDRAAGSDAGQTFISLLLRLLHLPPAKHIL